MMSNAWCDFMLLTRIIIVYLVMIHFIKHIRQLGYIVRVDLIPR